MPTISDLFRVELYCFVPASTYCVFYYLFGYYLSGRDLKSSVKWMLLVGGSLGFAGMLLLKLRGANVSVGGSNLFVAIYSAGLFSFCINNQFLERQAKTKIIQSLAKCSFGIYLLHPFFLNLLNKGMGVFPDILPAVIGELAFGLIGLVGSYIATLIIC